MLIGRGHLKLHVCGPTKLKEKKKTSKKIVCRFAKGGAIIDICCQLVSVFELGQRARTSSPVSASPGRTKSQIITS